MPIIQLKHLKKLGYPSAKHLPFLSEEIQKLGLNGSTTVVSFREMEHEKADETRKDITACSRINDLVGTNWLFAYLESDSPLAPLILWDAVHALPIGGTITLADEQKASYLERDYYRNAMIVENKDPFSVTLRKVALLPAEVDCGLDRWSFCIPTGPGDATLLNAVVKRILELAIPEKEILLCGRPGDNFKYSNQVRIVGDDITGTPVPICRKKNRLAEEARYENLCILHDRVFLPKDFDLAIRDFGDHFPLSTFQCLYFDDRWNTKPRRYSDAARALSDVECRPVGLVASDTPELSHFSPAVLIELEATGFMYSNALRYEKERCHTTGSLYLVKRAVWLKYPQNNNMAWAEYEDLEHAYRANEMGVPNRVNPHGLTQSIISRPIFSIGGRFSFEDMDGSAKQTSRKPWLPGLPLKPLIKITAADAYAKLALFSRKYVKDRAWSFVPQKNPNAITWLSDVGKLIKGSSFPLKQKEVKEFIDDFERWVLLDQLIYIRKKLLLEQFFFHGTRAKADMFEYSHDLISFATQRPRNGWFYRSLQDYFPRRSWLLYAGSFLSAIYLWRHHRRIMYYPNGGLRGYFNAILNSTPYSDYAEDKE